MARGQFRETLFVRRVVIALGIATAFAFGVMLLWVALPVVLLVFAGILLGIALQGPAEVLSRRSGLQEGASLTLVIIAVVIVLGGTLWLLSPHIASQIDQLAQRLPESYHRLKEYIARFPLGRELISAFPEHPLAQSGGGTVLARATGVVSTAFNWMIGLIVILFVGIYSAAEPRLYRSGIVRLFPLDRRARVEEVLRELVHSLRWWLVGRAVSMLVMGAMTTVGLWLLGIPLALALGLLAALLLFVPYIGSIVALIPAALLALMESPVTAFYVALLYLAIHVIDGYLLTPLVQERVVQLPPALTITVQVLFGILGGILGIALATPLTAAGMTLVRMLYIEDLLGDRDE